MPAALAQQLADLVAADRLGSVDPQVVGGAQAPPQHRLGQLVR